MQHNEEAAGVLAISREDDEFRALVERYSRAIFKLAYRMTSNKHDAEDVVQETFMRAYQRLSQFKNDSDIGSWLYRFGVNSALDYIRARHRHVSKRESVQDRDAAWDDRLRTNDPSPDRLVLSSELRERISAALAELTPSERAALVLRHFEGCAIHEVAEVLDVRPNAARNTVFRAVKKLRKALEPIVGSTP
jgi:RNA polymerase sigma-70 factor, ECF subfamily